MAPMSMTIAEIAAQVQGTLRGGDPEHRISGAAPVDQAGPDHLSFVANPRYLTYVQGSRAGVLLVPEALVERVPEEVPVISVKDAHVAMYHVLRVLHPEQREPAAVHSTAVVAPDVENEGERGPLLGHVREILVRSHPHIGAPIHMESPHRTQHIEKGGLVGDEVVGIEVAPRLGERLHQRHPLREGERGRYCGARRRQLQRRGFVGRRASERSHTEGQRERDPTPPSASPRQAGRGTPAPARADVRHGVVRGAIHDESGG